MMTWRQVVEQALRELGGEGHLRDINEKVEGHPKTTSNPTWRDTIRRVVRQYQVFEALGKGNYRLRCPQAPSAHPVDAHGRAQGMILSVGLNLGYETFAPLADQAQRNFEGKRLSDFVTARNAGTQSRAANLVDAIWLQEDEEGLYPKVAFEVEITTGVESGMLRLLKIPARYNTRLAVIAESQSYARKFQTLLSQPPFRPHAARFTFLPLNQLEDAYNAAPILAAFKDSLRL